MGSHLDEVRSPAETDDTQLPPPAAEYLWMPTWIVASLHLLAWITVGVWLTYRVQHTRMLLEDFDIEVSEATMLLVGVQGVLVSYWFVCLPLAVALTCADAWIDRQLVQAGRYAARTVWFLIGLTPPALLMLATLILLDLAFLQLVQHLWK